MDDGLAVRLHEPLARHTAHRTGGPCEAWVVVHRMSGLRTVLAECRAARWPLSVLGAGTRTVVRDGAVLGAVLRLGGDFATYRNEGDTWVVGAAVPVPSLVGACVRHGRTGVEHLAAVPGSVGASVLLDDGWDDVVESVTVVRQGPPRAVGLSAARRARSGAVVTEVRLRLRIAESEEVGARAKAALSGSAPVPPGSWYAPAQGEPVREVFQSVRLQLVRLRDVAIPPAAPELVVNLGGGTAADLELLAKSAFDRVKKVRGSQLAPRIRWMGRAPDA